MLHDKFSPCRSVFAIIFLIAIIFPACKKSTVPPVTIFAMDTVCTINAYDDGTKELYDEIASRLSELENVFSVTIEDSEIAKINEISRSVGIAPVKVERDAMIVVKTALEIAEKTDGAFNPAAGVLIDLWGINTDHAKVPTESEIQNALELCDWKSVKIFDNNDKGDALNGEKNEIYIEKKGVLLNLGGIAKGYAADCVVEILKNRKVKKAIIDLGGNVVVFGKKENGKPWIVGIKNPAAPEGSPLLKLEVEGEEGEGKSVVTSGNYERFFEKDGRRYHHIFDTKTGFPSESKVASSTIITKSSMLADALSTASFVIGTDFLGEGDFGGSGGKSSVGGAGRFSSYSDFGDISVIFITDDGEVVSSKNSLPIKKF